jgi:membrane-bound metal-dependent hydrolase YbcI (DUF457 family)
MFPLGHIGIGTWIVPARIRDGFSWAWFVVGCVLPDLIDKPVFIAARVASRHAPEQFDVLLDALRGSRLVGHSLFFFALLVAIAWRTRSAAVVALAWGVGSHLLLDVVADLVSGSRVLWPSWLLWPVFGWDFPRFTDVGFERTVYRAGEFVGAALVLLEVARRRRSHARRPPPAVR